MEQGVWQQVVAAVQKDMEEPIGYVPLGIWMAFVILGVGLVIWLLWDQEKRSPFPWKKAGILFLLVVYGVVLIQLAFFSREPGSRIGLDLTFGDTWGTTPWEHAFFIENVIMFVPFGILVSMLSRRLGIWKVTLLGCLSSCMLEGMQYVTQRGFCQLDDVVTNTAGALIGACVITGVRWMFGLGRKS